MNWQLYLGRRLTAGTMRTALAWVKLGRLCCLPWWRHPRNVANGTNDWSSVQAKAGALNEVQAGRWALAQGTFPQKPAIVLTRGVWVLGALVSSMALSACDRNAPKEVQPPPPTDTQPSHPYIPPSAPASSASR